MELLTPIVTGVLLALFTGIQTWINKGRFDSIDRRFEQVDRRFEQLSGEIAQLRSDLLQVALAGRPHPQTG